MFTCLVVVLLFALVIGGVWVAMRGTSLERMGIGSADCVAVVEIGGIITESREVIERLHRFRDNERVKAVVLRIDSPGGSVGPAQEIYAEVLKLREVKPVVASLGSVAASGGYYIACAAQHIVANPGTITGSIGVILEFANVEELMGKIGLKSVVIKSGRYKDILSPTREITGPERELLQGVIDSIHGQFIDAVASGRSLPHEQVVALADGRIFSGAQAQGLGLLDALGNLQDALDTAGALGGIAVSPKVIYPEKKRPAIWEFFIQEALGRFGKRSGAGGALFMLHSGPVGN